MNNMGTVYLLGIDCQHPGALRHEVLKKCTAVFVSSRLRKDLQDVLAIHGHLEVVPLLPLQSALLDIRGRLATENVAVIASGDPLFFGIGRKLIETIGANHISIQPAVSSMQVTCSRFAVPWDDCMFLSLHGRDDAFFLGKILASDKTVLLTDQVHRPEIIAATLAEFIGDQWQKYRIHVAENLGSADERLVSGYAFEIAEESFGALCCMLIVRQPFTEHRHVAFGLGEDEIQHSRGLITKNEVRAAAIHALAVPEGGVVWDVGAGSGAVGLEIARMNRTCRVYSIEKEQEHCSNIKENIQRFGMNNMQVLVGSAPGVLHDLPDPDAIFVGGSGGHLEDILQTCATRLRSGRKIVVSAVLERTATLAPAILHSSGLRVEIRKIHIERRAYPDNDWNLFNPIQLTVGHKLLSTEYKS